MCDKKDESEKEKEGGSDSGEEEDVEVEEEEQNQYCVTFSSTAPMDLSFALILGAGIPDDYLC